MQALTREPLFQRPHPLILQGGGIFPCLAASMYKNEPHRIAPISAARMRISMPDGSKVLHRELSIASPASCAAGGITARLARSKAQPWDSMGAKGTTESHGLCE